DEIRRQLAEAQWKNRLPADLALCGRPFTELRQLGRRTALQTAQDYLAAAGQSVAISTGFPSPLLMAGHQPELFHPGVWVKNFALHGLARCHGGSALNLVVDNDTAKTNLLRFPVETAPGSELYQLHSLPFDYLAAQAPYEERQV